MREQKFRHHSRPMYIRLSKVKLDLDRAHAVWRTAAYVDRILKGAKRPTCPWSSP
jgi:hypothetical protein